MSNWEREEDVLEQGETFYGIGEIDGRDKGKKSYIDR